MRPTKLTEAEIDGRLTGIPGWTLADSVISKTYSFKDFVQSMEFVNLLAEAAEAVQHHPDIDIRYNKVTIALSTHDVGGLTENDFNVALLSDEFAAPVSG